MNWDVRKAWFKKGIDWFVAMRGSVSRRKEISKKSTLDYKEMHDELVNQNEIQIKLAAAKEDMDKLEANVDSKMNKTSNVLLEKLQNIIAKTFGSAEINRISNSSDGNKNKCAHKIGLLNDRLQSLEVENSFLKNEIHELTTLLNTITISFPCKSKTTEMENNYMRKMPVKNHLTTWVMLITALVIRQIPMQ